MGLLQIFVWRFSGRQERQMSIQIGSKAEQATNEECLTDRIAFSQSSHSSLPDHVPCFDSLQSPPGALERTVALPPFKSIVERDRHSLLPYRTLSADFATEPSALS
jgi:hypothetical protein